MLTRSLRHRRRTLDRSLRHHRRQHMWRARGSIRPPRWWTKFVLPIFFFLLSILHSRPTLVSAHVCKVICQAFRLFGCITPTGCHSVGCECQCQECYSGELHSNVCDMCLCFYVWRKGVVSAEGVSCFWTGKGKRKRHVAYTVRNGGDLWQAQVVCMPFGWAPLILVTQTHLTHTNIRMMGQIPMKQQ